MVKITRIIYFPLGLLTSQIFGNFVSFSGRTGQKQLKWKREKSGGGKKTPEVGMGSNQDFANASRIELFKCECESNRVGHCECESNQKTANCESICELRPKMGQFLKAFLPSYKIFKGKNVGSFF